ncbi:MFS transporter [Devosia sp. SL43]|uniref:MFS transporter n=1 Tax=Devosia sp. SL43 TaxID=2806348 RepID=UPI001F3E4894|nr:MFS transporter [Devosia sp. SL43]UJW85586.1 MFS transporter [Devosia sp. SL43]
MKPLVALAAAQVLSLAGTRLSTIAVPWLVLTTTGDPVLTGLVALAELLPYVLAKGLGGPVIDRTGPKRVAIWCDTASALAIGTVPVLHLMDLLTMPLLLVLLAVIGALRGPSDAAKGAMVPEIARLAGVPLERVTGITGAIERLAGTVGAAAAGALIALMGPAEALIFNAVAFALTAVVVAVAIPLVAAAAPEGQPSRYGRRLAEGWQFLRRDPVLVGIVMMVAVTNLIDQASAGVMLPVWVKSHGYDASMLGAILAAYSGTSIAGSALAAAIGSRLPRLTVYVIAFLFSAPPFFAVLALGLPLPAIFAVVAISGFSAGFLNPIIGALMFERIPKALVGRVTALIGALAWSLMPFGGVLGGLWISGIGLNGGLWIATLVYLTATLAPLLHPGFRQFGRREAATDQVA